MNALLLLTATAALGIDYGYQPLPTGGVEYIIQIEPQLLAQVAAGKPIMSDVPPGLDVRRFTIVVGNGQLPRELPAGTIRDGRPQMQPDAPTESRPHMNLDEKDRSRPVMRADEASQTSATQGFPSEAPPRMDTNQPLQTPFDRRPVGVTAESQQSRPLLAPELEAAPPAQPPQEVPFNNNSLGPRYVREVPPASAPLRSVDPGLRMVDRTQPPVEVTSRTSDSRYGSTSTISNPPQPQPTSQFAPGRQFGVPPLGEPASTTPSIANKPPMTAEQEEALRESKTPFWVALFGFFCSAGGNVYLGWMTWSARMKYQNLVLKFRSQPSPA